MGQLEDIQLFVQVVDAGGIGPAANQMAIAKSAVSRRLSELERRLNITLITRTTRASKITEEGQKYYTRSLQLINEFDELNNLTAEPDSLLSGALRISSPISFGLSHLTPALDIFAKNNPSLLLDVDLTNQRTDLIEGGFDLGFRIGNLQDSSLKARKVAQISFNICASPEYLKQHGIPKTPDELKNHQLLKLSLEEAGKWIFFDNEGNKSVINTSPKILSNNNDFMKTMAIAGHGIIRTTTFASSKAIKTGELIPILQDYTLDELNIYAVYPQTRYLSRRVRLLIDFLVDRFGSDSYWYK